MESKLFQRKLKRRKILNHLNHLKDLKPSETSVIFFIIRDSPSFNVIVNCVFNVSVLITCFSENLFLCPFLSSSNYTVSSREAEINPPAVPRKPRDSSSVQRTQSSFTLVIETVGVVAATPHPYLFVTGRRRNCDVTDEAALIVGEEGKHNVEGAAVAALSALVRATETVPMSAPGWLFANVSSEAALAAALRRRCPLFGDDAQDYFITSPGAFDWAAPLATDGLVVPVPPQPSTTPAMPSLRQLRSVPPLVVGGIAFDNWLLSQSNRRRDMLVIDGSVALSAFHLNHYSGSDGTGRDGGVDAEDGKTTKKKAAALVKMTAYDALRESHKKRGSAYNERLAHGHGGWAKGKTGLAPYVLVPDAAGALRRRLAPGTPNPWPVADPMAVHERAVVVCATNDADIIRHTRAPCHVPHYNLELKHNDPPDAFSRPYVGRQ